MESIIGPSTKLRTPQKQQFYPKVTEKLHPPFGKSINMKTSKILHFLCRSALSAAFLFSSLPAAQAQTTYYWDLNGTDPGPGTTPSGTWTVGGNWNNAANGSGTLGTAPGALDTAYFTAGASGAQAGASTYTVSLEGASVSVDKITFSSTAPTVIGSSVGDGTITLGIGGISIPRAANGGSGNTSAAATIQSNINLNGDQAWSQDMGLSGNLTISGNVGGTGNLTLTSLRSGRNIVLSGSVNHTGTLVTGSQTSNTIVSGNIGSNVTNVSANGNGVFILSGTNTYTGNSTISGSNSGTATLRIGSNSAIVSTSTITLNSGTNASNSRLDLGDGANSFNASIVGLLNSGTRQGRSVVTNSSTGTGTGTLTINPATANTFSGLIQDGTTAKVAISVGGADTLTLSGANSYTGGTTVSSGALVVRANAATVTDVTVASVASGTATQTATVADTTGLAIGQTVSAPNLAVGTFIIGITSGTTLQLSAFATAANTSSGTFSAYQTLGNGPVTISGGTLSSSTTNLNTAAFTMSSGNLNLNSTSAGTVTLASGTNLNMTGGTWFWSVGDQFIGTATGTFAISGATLDLTGVTEGDYVLATGFDPVGANSAEFFSQNLGVGLSASTSILDGVLTLHITSGGLSNNANLSSLVVNTATLSPAFDSATINYTASVPYATTSVTVTPTRAQAAATITVNGNAVTSGNPSSSITLDEGANVITTVVTAEDNSTKTYTVTITREAPATLTDWRLAWYDTTENSGNAADTASPFGTGISNLFVYAFMGPGQDPATAKSHQLPQFVLDATNLSFTFTEPEGVSGVTYGAEYRTDLLTGSWLPVTDTGSGSTHIFSVARGSNTKLFLRLTVTPNP
jgi:large repetitive protein